MCVGVCAAYSVMERQSLSPPLTLPTQSSLLCVCVCALSFQIRLAQQGRGADNIVDVAVVDIES